MLQNLLLVLRLALAGVAGYLVIALGTTLVLETLLGGVSYADSSALELAVAGLGSVVAGLAGGLVAAWIGGARPVRHAAAVIVLLAIDTHFVMTTPGVSTNPWWFDLAAGLALAAAAVGGGLVRAAWIERGRGERLAAS